MPDPLANLNTGANIDTGMSGLEDSKLKKYIKLILVLSSIFVILSSILIFSIFLNLKFSLKLPLTIEHLGIIAGVCAFICGIYTIIGLIKERKSGI